MYIVLGDLLEDSEVVLGLIKSGRGGVTIKASRVSNSEFARWAKGGANSHHVHGDGEDLSGVSRNGGIQERKVADELPGPSR